MCSTKWNWCAQFFRSYLMLWKSVFYWNVDWANFVIWTEWHVQCIVRKLDASQYKSAEFFFWLKPSSHSIFHSHLIWARNSIYICFAVAHNIADVITIHFNRCAFYVKISDAMLAKTCSCPPFYGPHIKQMARLT